MNTKRLKKKLTAKPKKHPEPTAADFLSSGCTVLNLACSGRRMGCFQKGHYYFFVGDSASGKTFLTLTALAEAANNPNFDDYRLILIDVEHGAMMNMQRYFGQRLVDRLEIFHPEKIEDMYDLLAEFNADGRPYLCVVDSMDALSSEDEIEKSEEQRRARAAGREAAGSYGDGKAKKNSAGVRQILGPLWRTGSILIFISQTRDNIGFTAKFNPKTRAGGRALRFYAALELWSSIKGQIKKQVKGQQRQVGIVCEIKIKKNRIAGKDRTVLVPIYQSHGIDDVGACVDFLVQEKHWTTAKTRAGRGLRGEATTERQMGKGSITAPEFDYTGSVEGLVQKIEQDGAEKELRALVQSVWNEIESGCVVERKSRYS